MERRKFTREFKLEAVRASQRRNFSRLDYATLLSFFATPILTLDQRLKRHGRLSGAISVLSLMDFNWTAARCCSISVSVSGSMTTITSSPPMACWECHPKTVVRVNTPSRNSTLLFPPYSATLPLRCHSSATLTAPFRHRALKPITGIHKLRELEGALLGGPMIFFSVFWSAFAPIVLVILWLIADGLTQHLHGANGHWKSATTMATVRRHRHR